MDQCTIAVRERASSLAADLAQRGATEAKLAVVLGSGLGVFAERLEEAETIPFKVLPEMPRSAVPGHAGNFVLGKVAGETILVQKGRVHLYEGWSPFEVTRAVRAFSELGIQRLLLTNAAGCLRPEWPVPGLMRLDDHIARQGPVGLLRGESRSGNPYDAEHGAIIDRAAKAESVALQEGTYVGLMGPSYESPAEIRLLARAGASAVGMSTVAEASVARACGIRVSAISCLSNLGAGLSPGALSHAEVVEAGRSIAQSFVTLLRASVPGLVKS